MTQSSCKPDKRLSLRVNQMFCTELSFFGTFFRQASAVITAGVAEVAVFARDFRCLSVSGGGRYCLLRSGDVTPPSAAARRTEHAKNNCERQLTYAHRLHQIQRRAKLHINNVHLSQPPTDLGLITTETHHKSAVCAYQQALGA